MKKTLSLALSLLMLISCFSFGGFNALAATDLKTVPEYKLGDTFRVTYDSKAENDIVVYAKFVPETTDSYEFTLNDGISPITIGTVYAMIADYNYKRIASNYCDAEFPDAPSVAVKMQAGKTYYFVLLAEDCGTYKTEVTIKKHVHKKVVVTEPAVYEYDAFFEEVYADDGIKTEYCEYCDDYVKPLAQYYAPESIILSQTKYTYNGKAKKPAVTVKDRKGGTIAPSNYTVKYSANTNVGTAKVTVTFKGEGYKGVMTANFVINPKGTTLAKLTAKSKGFTVKWNKQAQQVTGYQVQYSTAANFKSAKTVTVKGAGNTSTTIAKLKGKKKYYVRIRTYKTVGGKKYYSAWSKAKTVTTKK